MIFNKTEREAAIQGINRFIFCGWNYDCVRYTFRNSCGVYTTYVPRVITETKWNCDLDHIVSKWSEATKSDNPDAYFVRFYAELSADNRRAFLNSIIDNYYSEQRI